MSGEDSFLIYKVKFRVKGKDKPLCDRRNGYLGESRCVSLHLDVPSSKTFSWIPRADFINLSAIAERSKHTYCFILQFAFFFFRSLVEN